MPIVRLFVTNLEYSVVEDDLREVFSKVGKPTIINIMKNRDTGKPRGFGFVTLDTLDEPPDCWRPALQGHKLKGRPIHIDFAIPKENKVIV
jgi:RNA recognition motif-containing protein